jgi:hypothetical protein
MPREKQPPKATAPPQSLDLRSKHQPAPPGQGTKRFNIFLIDTGWNAPVSKLVRSHLALLCHYESQDSIYQLSPEQSVEILKRAPELIGLDPTILVYDLYAPADRKHGRFRGFRLNLGRFKSAEQAMARLQEFIRFLMSHRSAVSLDAEVRRELHREGARGLIKILREASNELL